MPHTRPQTISEALLEPEQFLALHIGDTPSSKQISNDTIRTKDSEIWFFQVADVGELTRYPIRLFDTNGSALGPISSGGSQDYTKLFDSNGDDILRNDDDDWTVYHFSIGVRQDDLRIYPRIPTNQNGGAFTYLTGDQPDPTSPSRFGFEWSSQTSIEDPSTRLESVTWRIDTESKTQYGFFNDAEVQLDPILSVVGLAYQLRPVVDQDAKLNLLADMGRPIDKQENRVHTVSYSRAALRTFSYDPPEEWKDAQNSLTVQEANLPEDIEEFIEQSEGEGVNGGGS